eukprot:915732-Karenia_brevis.AAC.1
MSKSSSSQSAMPFPVLPDASEQSSSDSSDDSAVSRDNRDQCAVLEKYAHIKWATPEHKSSRTHFLSDDDSSSHLTLCGNKIKPCDVGEGLLEFSSRAKQLCSKCFQKLDPDVCEFIKNL